MNIKNWVMKFHDFGDIECTIPCSMYGVLIENKQIEDPFYGTNEEVYSKLSDYPCTFTAKFDVEKISNHNELVLAGVDTVCDIYLNGKKLASVKNMHRTYTFEVGEKLKLGENEITLEISSPTEYFKYMESRHHVFADKICLPGVSQLRKGFWMSGWDWGPCLPDMGIHGEVLLNQYEVDVIEDFFIRQIHKDGKVTLSFSLCTKHNEKDLTATVFVDGKSVTLEEGTGEITIDNPKLWWPHGYGDQPLYEVCAEISKNGEVIDTVKKTVGLRTLTVSTAKDKHGNEFCFVVNGVKVFAMGANYVPQDNIISRVTKEKIDALIDACVDANFNTIRVWGGGYYPSEDFFDACDRAGLLVWQDMMIACANVWLSDEMREEYIAEFAEQMKRFSHRACIGIVSGNNEMEWYVCNTEGACENYTEKLDHLELYERISPSLLSKYAPDTFYWPSSPSSGGGFDDPNDDSRGDQHYWAVWHGSLPFEDYRNHKFRFCSEFGFESFPSVKTIDTFCPEKDKNIFSRVMEKHQKCQGGNKKIFNYIAENYLYPSSFENVIYASQLNQAEAIRYGVEHFRRNRGICMGSIYWQLNDCWPVASWSSVDCFGRYKALHYAARKFYAPIAGGLFREDGYVTFNIANETMKDFHGFVKMRTIARDFSVIREEGYEVTVPSLSSKDVCKMSEEFVTDVYGELVVAEIYDAFGSLVTTRCQLFTKEKYFKWENPNLRAEIRDIDGGIEITVTADSFAKAVEIDFESADIILSDNYFDITRGSVTVTAKTGISAAQLRGELRLKSVYDIDK